MLSAEIFSLFSYSGPIHALNHLFYLLWDLKQETHVIIQSKHSCLLVLSLRILK